MPDDWKPTPEDWQPISEELLWDKINGEWSLMDFQERRLWDVVKIVPEKWSNQQKYYDQGSWVLAIIGSVIVWYDDIEEEFTRSHWVQYGTISDGRFGAEAELRGQLLSFWMRFKADDIGMPPNDKQ